MNDTLFCFRIPWGFKPPGHAAFLGLELITEDEIAEKDFIFCSPKFLKSSNQIWRSWTARVEGESSDSVFYCGAAKIQSYAHLSIRIFLMWNQIQLTPEYCAHVIDPKLTFHNRKRCLV